MDSGVPYAKTVGISQMHLLCVECWVSVGPGQPDVVLSIKVGLGPSG